MPKFPTDKLKRCNVMITDLDQSDHSQQLELPKTERQQQERIKHVERKPQTEKRLRTISGNFKRRSRSAECHLEPFTIIVDSGQIKTQGTKTNNYFNELLQSKDKQMEQLLQRLASLHKCNEQFADENKALRDEVQALEEKITQLKQRIKDCTNCRRLQLQLQSTADETKSINTDISMLKTLVYRLNVQIEYYQDKLREGTVNNNANLSNSSNSATHVPAPIATLKTAAPADTWTDSLHSTTLGPLLKAYDEMLKERQELIQQYKQQFEIFTDELKSVLEENARLLQTNQTLKRNFGAWREDRTRLQAQVDVCRAKAEAQTRKSDLAKEKLVEVMQCYEKKMQSVSLDMEQLQNAYKRCKSELVAMKSASAQPPDGIAYSLQECKTILEQLKTEHNQEKSMLEQQMKELREQHASITNTLQQQKIENAELQKTVQARMEHEEELRKRNTTLQRTVEKLKHSRDRLKTRLRVALQWAQKLEEGQTNMQNTWDALRRLETIVKHKESQVRGLHARHLEELDKMQQKLAQKEETIRKILRSKLEPSPRGS